MGAATGGSWAEEACRPQAISPQGAAAALKGHWFPHVVGEVDDAYVKVAKLQGSLAWHSHENEDELFYILKGRLRIEMEQAPVELREGEMLIVPKGVRHNPVAEQECHVLLIERKSTLHTGNVVTEKTRSIAEQMQPADQASDVAQARLSGKVAMTDHKVQLTRWSDLPKERLNDLLERRIINGDKMMLTHVYLKRGCIVPMHEHENEQFTYVLEGELRFSIGSEDAEPISVKAGEVLHIPSNVRHKAEALGDTLDVDIFCPPRRDWLDKTDSYLRR